MANKHTEAAEAPMTGADLKTFVTSQSDFAFEMAVLRELKSIGFTCSHSGTYVDPITDKIRQFDIRAIGTRNSRRLAMAVECKNIQPTAPVLVTASPRTRSEAVIDLIHSEGGFWPSGKETKATDINFGIYDPLDMVGRKIEQVKRVGPTGTLQTLGDEFVFGKMSQAINSSRELIWQSLVEVRGAALRHLIVPVLVIPAETLWQVDYDDTGEPKGEPRQIARSTLFIGHTWTFDVAANAPTARYRLSHLEIVTAGSCGDMPERYFGDLRRMTS